MGERLAVLGAGAVGRSVLELADGHGHTVVGIADSQSAAIDPTGVDSQAILDAKNAGEAVGDGDIADILASDYDVLIEATPTTLGDAEPGFSHVRAALESDKDVVLANKGPVAERFADLKELERESAGTVRFEATVGGAIPILSVIQDYGANRIEAVRGVLNGTANFILTRMSGDGLDFAHVLAEAQDLGVAEADPSFDVDGTDAALKCVILANVLTGGDPVYSLEDATVEGIEDIPGMALELAAADGRTVRLIGEATRSGIAVAPKLVPENGTLAVTGTQNIVQLTTSDAGQLNISGRGAGGPETATAILADVNRLSI